MYDAVESALNELRSIVRKAPEDAALLLRTADDPNPVGAFCRAAGQLGVSIDPMDLVNAGEEYYAGMRRSTNGGGENSPLLDGEDDYYEMFMAELRGSKS